ncbi:exonuclease domain-containing protein [Corynebacterium marinum]|uniref:DNA polymerase III epsilon subunit n=1 Tax=Corynebacterium marinum DSM 44953 TaxID=1224162 RepID=A0A0B6TSX0_9CORY|nr:exonuclease domain-containing protein [Corynebacterium marinum]AJK68695.1 DNA polymerase III epsilon subunit [Corynebacterium marinum DSM 44953]GGO13948.1 DNA polymerase III subunit epsilon [Corynebacterium marinum]
MWPFRSDPAVKATGPLKEFYATRPPADNTPLDELPLLAVDVETTGLKPGKHQLVSIGWVPVDGTRIDLSGAGYVVLRGAEGFTVGSSATIHQLTDDQIAAGIDHADAVGQLLRALTGRVLLGHFVAMEEGFLSLACERLFDAPLKVPMVDTFAIERRHMERMGTYPRGEDLRLARVRQRYGLPDYHNHNALTDALACAEQYLAHRATLPMSTLKDVMG